MSPLVEVFDQKVDLAAENAVTGVDLLDCELGADQFVLAQRSESAGERIVEADLDWLVGEGLDHERACDLQRADRETGLQYRAARNPATDDLIGHYVLP